jgi:hypothetical protein
MWTGGGHLIFFTLQHLNGILSYRTMYEDFKFGICFAKFVIGAEKF